MEFYKIKLQMVKDKTINLDGKIISKPIDIVNFINSLENYSLACNEYVVVIALNTKSEIVAYSEISSGGINLCNIDIPSIFRVLFATNANRFILVHNHPSGNSKPSQIDIDTTKQIKSVAKIMKVQFLDHIIIGDNEYTSIFSETKL